MRFTISLFYVLILAFTNYSLAAIKCVDGTRKFKVLSSESESTGLLSIQLKEFIDLSCTSFQAGSAICVQDQLYNGEQKTGYLIAFNNNVLANSKSAKLSYVELDGKSVLVANLICSLAK